VINFLFKGIPSACGIDGQCQAQYIIEADGSVYPCDFYVLDEYNAGNVTRQTLREIFETNTVFYSPVKNCTCYMLDMHLSSNMPERMQADAAGHVLRQRIYMRI
jgi:sulfatase maturation enzyme AslB (radical SAM superfamily)